MSKIVKRKKRPTKLAVLCCPICGRYHTPHPEFGPFCCNSCLQTAIRPLILTIPD